MDELPRPVAQRVDVSAAERRRVELTVSCRDADGVPKVPHAGEVVVEQGLPVQVMHEGTRVLSGAYYGAWMTEIISRLRGHHEPQEERVVHCILARLQGEAATSARALGSPSDACVNGRRTTAGRTMCAASLWTSRPAR